MTVLLELRRRKRVISVCDQRCYNGKGLRCNCICKGLNHGVGLEQAIQNCHNTELIPELDPNLPIYDAPQILNLGKDIPLPLKQDLLFQNHHH